jgi:hypothetical protein
MQIEHNRIIRDKFIDLIDEQEVEVVHQLCVNSSPRLFFYFKHQLKDKQTKEFIINKLERDYSFYWKKHKLED